MMATIGSRNLAVTTSNANLFDDDRGKGDKMRDKPYYKGSKGSGHNHNGQSLNNNECDPTERQALPIVTAISTRGHHAN